MPPGKGNGGRTGGARNAGRSRKVVPGNVHERVILPRRQKAAAQRAARVRNSAGRAQTGAGARPRQRRGVY